MNFAYVRISGEVVSDARVFQEGDRVGSLRFSVDDGTGVIDVRAVREKARGLVDANRVPRAGDRVELTGSLNVSSDSISLWLQVPEQMKLERGVEVVDPLGSLTAEKAGRAVLVEGRVVRVEAPRPGSRAPWRLLIQDDSGEAPAVFFDDVYRTLANPAALTPGTRLKGRARVGEYRGVLQLTLGQGLELFEDPPFVAKDDVILLPVPSVVAAPDAPPSGATPVAPRPSPPPATPTRLADLSRAMQGQIVRVSGRVVLVSPPPATSPRAPWRVELEAEAARAVLVFWSDVAQTLGAVVPAVGDRFEAEGKVKLYREALQIEIHNASDLRRLEAAPPAPVPTAAAESEVREPLVLGGLDKLTPDLTGQVVRVSGRLGPSRPIRSGVAFPLTGGATHVQVVLWDRFVPEAARGSLREGVDVEVTGRVRRFKDQLEIVPQQPGDVTVRAGVPAP